MDTSTFYEIQNDLAKGLSPYSSFKVEEIKYVAGVDIAYFDFEDVEYGICCIVIVDFITNEIIEQQYDYDAIQFPYIPGLLSFREVPLFEKTLLRVSTQPDLYLFDGNGYLHPRHMVLASQASFSVNRPTIGVAKTYYKLNNRDYRTPADKEGAFEDIVFDNIVCGRVLRTQKDTKPIFVSVGNWISIDDCCMIVMKLIEKGSRLPVPLRYADIGSRKYRKIIQDRLEKNRG